MSTSKQRQMIGFLRKSLNLEEETYREILTSTFAVNSSKDLSEKQAEILILQLRKTAEKIGIVKPRKYSDLDRTGNMASPKQLRMIEAMWFDVSYQTSVTKRKRAFEHFILRITGKQKLQFLTVIDVRKIVKALQSMKGVKNGTSC